MIFLKKANNTPNSPIKQVIVIRKDITLGKGKLAGQVAHAAVAGYRIVMGDNPEVVAKWEMWGEKKVVVKVENEKELVDLFQKLKDKKIPVALIRDAGLTQIKPGTKTCFAIGPWYEDQIDKFTKDLKLL
ncbi:peptidyl-tRNA hydrolase Pth2 [Candidatus Micrarchaeota archaeon]|jgi:PTH2 family peptidyl-tRNA hydrolase|nr:peptidyl-tRNA hydrolase Pth2 [Candidatus Micrarchaeota archaeon]